MKTRNLGLKILIVSLIVIIGSISYFGHIKNPINNPDTRISENLEIGVRSSNAKPPREVWNITWGIPGIYSSCNDIAIDSDNNIYTVGQVGSMFSALSNITLYKTNSSGVHLWNRTIESDYLNRGFGVATNGSEYVYITGYVNWIGPENMDVVVAAYNESGDLEWLETWGGSGQEAGRDIAVDSLGNIYVTGVTTSYGVENGALLLLKYNSTGDLQWNQTWDSSYGESGCGIDIDKTTGEIYVVGSVSHELSDNSSAILLKYDSDKNKIWERIWDSGSNETGEGVKVDSNGDICITGNIYAQTNERDLFLAKYNNLGDQIWNSTLDFYFDLLPWDIDIDDDDNIYIAGSARLFSYSTVWIGKFNINGNQIWNKTWGGTGRDFGHGIALDSSNYPYITGSFDSDDMLGFGDNFILKLSTSYCNGALYGWAWMAGNKTINEHGIYGTKGVPNMANYPGARRDSVSWTDTEGNLWLFGGYGYNDSGVDGYLNDLWRFNISSKEWAWMAGNKTINEYGVYGTKGDPDMANYPGARERSVCWTDTDGNFWLFGGYGFNESSGPGMLNDLWRFNITSKEWTWISGNKTLDENGVYGTKGVPDMANYPGARDCSVSWRDTDGNLWLFGGIGYPESDFGMLNDLWRFNKTSKEWAWISGNKTFDENGVYGTKGVPNMTNYPGARLLSVSWTDMDGNLWLFGGYGFNELTYGDLNDLWGFNITSKEWAWMSGNKTLDENGVYGTKGVPDMANYPGARDGSVSWTDTDGNLWLFGGEGWAESDFGKLNDLWRFGSVEKSQSGGQIPITGDGEDDEDDDDDDDDNNGKAKDTMWFWLLIIIGSVSVIAATSLYYIHHKNKKAKSTIKRRYKESNKFIHSIPTSKEILKKLSNKGLLLQIFDIKAIKTIGARLDNIDLTAVSNKFLKKLDSINISIEEKREFLKEMMLFSPEERNEILDNILKRLNSYYEGE
ncbi:MAG: kelch repeat-containing protein [Candidatus Hodarchaeota archaeon]